jgi:hypothetical protein
MKKGAIIDNQDPNYRCVGDCLKIGKNGSDRMNFCC